MNLIEIERLFFAYVDTLILNDLTMSVAKGEFVGIIGPNGGGKTTLLKLIMGFYKPLSGTLLLNGHPPRLGKESIGYVPQVQQFDRSFPITVFELVLTGRLFNLPWHGVYSKKDKEVVLEALSLLGLLPFKNASFATLSGGQLQRALIARALVTEPTLLILDEPTANVDKEAEGVILSILKKLAGSITILMVTHDLKTSLDSFDRVICVEQQAVSLKREEVCEHFAVGLYHKPLMDQKK